MYKGDTENYEKVLKSQIEEKIRNESFVNLIENIEKLKNHFKKENNENIMRMHNLKGQYELWLSDVQCSLNEGIGKKLNKIEIKNFSSNNITSLNSSVFNDFNQVNYERLLYNVFSDQALVNKNRPSKRLKDGEEEEKIIYTKSKLDTGQEINFIKTQDIVNKEIYVNQEEGIFPANIDRPKSINKVNNYKKQFYEDIIEEMPSKEEENIKLSFTDANNWNEENNLIENEFKIAGIFSDIKKKSSCNRKSNKLSEINSFLVIEEEYLNNKFPNEVQEKEITIDNKSEIDKLKTNNSQENKFDEINPCQSSIKDGISNNLINSKNNVDKNKNIDNKSSLILSNEILVTNNHPSQSIINNFKNILDNQTISSINKTKISNDFQINSNLSFKNQPDKQTSLLSFNLNSKGNVKSNIIKEKENIVKLVYDKAENLNLSESPVVERWSPKESVNENLHTNDYKKDVQLNPQVSKINTHIQSTKSKSHNNIFDNRQTVDRNKDLINLISKKKYINTINENSTKYFKENNTLINLEEKFDSLKVDKLQNNFPQNYQNDFYQGYEITDKSETSDDDDDSDYHSNYCTPLFGVKKKKLIPDWANDKNYLINRTKEQQKIDYKQIFGKVKIENLDLNLIFSGDKKYDDPRGDSADWGHDNSASSRCPDSDNKKCQKKIDFN